MAVRVLFLSRFNSARSQMAESFLRELGGAGVDAQSAGSAVYGVDPRAVLMAERDIDISDQRSKAVDEYIGPTHFDCVVTTCVRDEDECPVFPDRAKHESWPFEDPARIEGGDAQLMVMFRDVRDQIEARVRSWLETRRRELAPGPDSSVAHRPVRPAPAMGRAELVGLGRKAAP